MKIYLIGSLRNPEIPIIANLLRDKTGHEIFDDWYSAGPQADDYWMEYEKGKGNNFAEALEGYPANHVFQFDKHHLDESNAVVLIMPAGKSGHLELGYALGKGIPGYILLPEEPERFDVMYRFASGIFYDVDLLVDKL